jgi:cytochrome c-type biogenesis protein CcmF
MYQNLVFVALAGAPLQGTVFPTISDLFSGQKISVNAPFYYKVDGPLFGLVLLLMGLAPLMSWRRTDLRRLARALAAPAVGASIFVGLAFVLGARDAFGLAGFGLAGFVIVVVLQEFRRGIVARRRHRREGVFASLYRLFRRGRQRYGGYLVHLGVAMLAVGILASTAYEKDVQVSLSRGDSVRVAGYTISYRGLREGRGRNYRSAYALLDVSKSGRKVGTIEPARRIYDKSPDQPTSEVGLLSSFTTDFYVVLAGWEDSGARAFFEIYIHPLMSWVWIGAALMLLGTLIALWPEPAPAYAAARLPASAEVAG